MSRWRRDGKELYFISTSGARKMMGVEIQAGSRIETGLPKMLFEVNVPPSVYTYAVTGDGQKFLLREPVTTSTGNTEPIHLVINWPAALAR